MQRFSEIKNSIEDSVTQLKYVKSILESRNKVYANQVKVLKNLFIEDCLDRVKVTETQLYNYTKLRKTFDLAILQLNEILECHERTQLKDPIEYTDLSNEQLYTSIRFVFKKFKNSYPLAVFGTDLRDAQIAIGEYVRCKKRMEGFYSETLGL